MLMEKTFAIKLAGIVIGIHPLFPEIREMCRDYLTNESHEFEISVSLEDICFERQKSDREAIIEGRKPSQYSDAYLETLAVYRKIAEKLVQYDVMLFHGSAVAVDGIGYLFAAKSGTGKRTHTRLWREYFGDRGHIGHPARLRRPSGPSLPAGRHGRLHRLPDLPGRALRDHRPAGRRQGPGRGRPACGRGPGAPVRGTGGPRDRHHLTIPARFRREKAKKAVADNCQTAKGPVYCLYNREGMGLPVIDPT